MTARYLASAAGILLMFAGPALANGDYPIRGNWLWQLGWQRWPSVQPSSSLAPWYVWWPANATESLGTPDFQSSPYPTWPSNYPQGTGTPVNQGMTTQAPQQYRQAVPVQPASAPRIMPQSYPYGR